jgi:hypothetical protein
MVAGRYKSGKEKRAGGCKKTGRPFGRQCFTALDEQASENLCCKNVMGNSVKTLMRIEN